MKVSFVVPCYRSEDTLEVVVREIDSTMAVRNGVAYEVVLVSDHSPDRVYDVIERLAAERPAVIKGLELARNFGQDAALMAGYALTTGDYVVSVDDDGQTPVDEVWSLIDALENGKQDAAFASYPEKKHGWFRNFGSRVNDWTMTWLLDKPRDFKVMTYFAARRFVIEEMLRYGQAFPYIVGLVLRTTHSVVNVPVRHRERVSGSSGYTFGKLLGLWMNGFTSFSVKPLRLASLAGLVCAAGGFGYGIFTIVEKLTGASDIPLGYSSLMSALLFIGGMIMLILGLIGEYIGRIYICINKSPQYVISRRTDDK